MKPESKLLRRIAAIPADEKLPISRFAREFNCSTSVVVDMVQSLIKAGQLDPETARPTSDQSSPQPKLSGDRLFQEVVAEADRRGITRTAASQAIFGHNGQLHMLKGATKRPAQARTIERVEQWLGRKINTAEPLSPGAVDCEEAVQHAKAAASSPSSPSPDRGEQEGDEDGGFAPTPEPSSCESLLSEQPNGAELADALVMAAHHAGQGLQRFLEPIAPRNTSTWLQQLRQARRPKAYTIARVRAFLAGQPLPEGRKPIDGVLTITRAEREAMGLPPSGREIRDNKTLELRAQERSKIAHLRDVADTRHAEREQRLKDVVEREAADRAARRLSARRLTTAHPLDTSLTIEDAVIDSIDLATERRARELDDLPNASSVLRRAQRDWPDQCAKVKALAEELGVTLGEAWRRVIAAGVDCLTDDEAVA